jgi:hypothetical protein
VSKDDKIFVNFIFHQQIIHDDDDFKKSFESNINVIFDGRLIYTILWQAIFSPNDLLIYDIYKHKIYTIYIYFQEKFDIKNCVNSSLIEIFSLSYIVLNFYFKYLNFHISPQKIISNLILSERIDSVIGNILNVIGPQPEEKISANTQQNIRRIIEFFDDSFEGEIPSVSRYEFYIALSAMKNSNFNVQVKK